MDPSAIDCTLLHAAAAAGDTDRVSALLAAGEDVHSRDRDGWHPLLRAASLGHAGCVSLLLRSGAELEAQAQSSLGVGSTALQLAAFNGHLDAVRALLAAGADTDFRNGALKSAHCYARESGHQQVALLLEDARGEQQARRAREAERRASEAAAAASKQESEAAAVKLREKQTVQLLGALLHTT